MSCRSSSLANIMGIGQTQRLTSVGVLLDDGPPGDTLPDRVMGAVAHAKVLELVSEIAGLGIEGDVRALRTRMLATTPAPVESR